jgi:hypothetical protein
MYGAFTPFSQAAYSLQNITNILHTAKILKSVTHFPLPARVFIAGAGYILRPRFQPEVLQIYQDNAGRTITQVSQAGL